MEQKTGASTPPIPAAGVDPAYIPGLTPPARPVEPVEPGDAAAPAVAEPPVDDAAEDAPAEVDAKDGPEAEPEADIAEEGAAQDDGPVFSVSDRRGSITADRTGITFTLDGETAEFGWDEIGAVEIDTPRFGRRFSVTVYTSTRRWFDTDVEAAAKSDRAAWTTELDAVLDAYFEEAAPEAAPESPEEPSEA